MLNTRALCVPHRALACYAVQLGGQGLGAEEVVGRLGAMMGTTRSCLIPEDFDYLRRGGRLTPLAAKFAHLVKAFPVMEQTDDGRRLGKLAIARSFKKAIAAVAADFEGRGVGEGYYVSVSHLPGCRFGLFELGPAFITQGGPSCIAVQAVDLGACPGLDLS